MPSFVWNHFKRIDKEKAVCMVESCGKNISVRDGSTRGMICHLSSLHKITEENSVKRDQPFGDDEYVYKREKGNYYYRISLLQPVNFWFVLIEC